MTLEAIKSTTGFNKATLYEVITKGYTHRYFEGKKALAELKVFAKLNCFTGLVVHTNLSIKIYVL